MVRVGVRVRVRVSVRVRVRVRVRAKVGLGLEFGFVDEHLECVAVELSRSKAADSVARHQTGHLIAREDVLSALQAVPWLPFTAAILTMGRPPCGRVAVARGGVSGPAARR